ncbi:MAG: T9SS type A sorting domain-containing protein [Sphingobacteriales bacterium]|nr:MAG: T9SS type A sorting domain-containing protein [Sphingobacteriales bacterium]
MYRRLFRNNAFRNSRFNYLPMKALMVVLLLWGSSALGQVPFLPASESTNKGDVFAGFAEYKSQYYFCGSREAGLSGQGEDSLSGFCIKTDSNGQVLKRFNLSLLGPNHYIKFNDVGAKNDHIYITGAVGYVDTVAHRQYLNKIFVLCLTTDLNLISMDAFAFGQNHTAALLRMKTVFLKDRIVMGYCSGLNQSINFDQSYLTVYDYNLNRIRHQFIDQTYLNCASTGAHNVLTGLQKSSDTTFTAFAQLQNTSYNALLIDTGLHILEWAGNLAARPHLPNARRNNKIPVLDDCSGLWHPSGAYFLGPVVATDSGNRLGVSKLANAQDTLRTSGVLPSYPYMGRSAVYAATESSLQLLHNQKEIIALGTNMNAGYTQASNAMLVAKYDTALNLLWYRSLSKANHAFGVAGIYELANHRLMVLASAYDFTTAATARTQQNLYAFILDSTGTALSTFTVPVPVQEVVSVYPNPSQDRIRFKLPAAASQATYTLTDLQGKIVRSGSYVSGEEISVENLAPANYIYQVRTSDGVVHAGMFTR